LIAHALGRAQRRTAGRIGHFAATHALVVRSAVGVALLDAHQAGRNAEAAGHHQLDHRVCAATLFGNSSTR
jgi:hypothetical protein